MSPFRATIGDMNTINKMINSFKIRDPKDIKIIILEPSQRDLVLQGGGALRAYEVGVFEVLCKKLSKEDEENNREDRLLFDIVAGTSIDATNDAILVSQALFENSELGKYAADKLHKF